jgi:hypothetical protein
VDNQHSDAQHNDAQHNDSQHNDSQHNEPQRNEMVIFNVIDTQKLTIECVVVSVSITS